LNSKHRSSIEQSFYGNQKKNPKHKPNKLLKNIEMAKLREGLVSFFTFVVAVACVNSLSASFFLSVSFSTFALFFAFLLYAKLAEGKPNPTLAYWAHTYFIHLQPIETKVHFIIRGINKRPKGRVIS
jgi:hypothetical protein